MRLGAEPTRLSDVSQIAYQGHVRERALSKNKIDKLANDHREVDCDLTDRDAELDQLERFDFTPLAEDWSVGKTSKPNQRQLGRTWLPLRSKGHGSSLEPSTVYMQLVKCPKKLLTSVPLKLTSLTSSTGAPR